MEILILLVLLFLILAGMGLIMWLIGLLLTLYAGISAILPIVVTIGLFPILWESGADNLAVILLISCIPFNRYVWYPKIGKHLSKLLSSWAENFLQHFD